MESIEKAKILRDQGLLKFLESNKTIFATDIPMNTIYGKLKIAVAKELISAAATETDNTGYSAEKLFAKSIACEMASVLGSRARVQFGNLDERILRNSVHGGVSYYLNESDAVSGARLQDLWTTLNSNLTILTVDYMTPTKVKDFGTAIAAFVDLGGTTTSINVVSPALTKEFKGDLKKSSDIVEYVKDLGKTYKISHPTFYNGINYACKIPPYPVHHTPVNFLLIDSISEKPLESVECKLSLSKLIVTSNQEGFAPFETVRAGKGKASFVKKEYVSDYLNINIIRGVENNFTFKMTPIPIPIVI